MALTVEDGTGVANADSYTTDAELVAFAAARGFTGLPAAETDRDVLQRLAFDYVEAHRTRFRGTKTNEGNEFSQFPRINFTIDGEDIANTLVPIEAKRAQMQLSTDAVNDDLAPTGDGQVVIREKVDVLETQFDAGGSPAPQPIFVKADRWLNTLFKSSGGINTVRV